MQAQRIHLRNARGHRSDVLTDVAAGHVTVHEVVRRATLVTGKPLLRIHLVALLRAAPGKTPEEVDRSLRRLLETLDLTAPAPKDLTVQWLVNFKSGGRRLAAWLDATQPSGPPWPGFPFTPCPW